jgi:hypothetical protein
MFHLAPACSPKSTNVENTRAPQIQGAAVATQLRQIVATQLRQIVAT